MTDTSIRPLLTVPEVAAIMRFGIQKVRDLLNDGDLPGKKYGNTWRVSPDELDAYLARLSKTGQKAPAPAQLVTRRNVA